jgi:hypothetical protein
VAVRPLRPATDRRLGEPLPHQLANRTRAPLQAPGLTIPSFDLRLSKGRMSCGISVPFETLSPTRRQVTHALLTRLPLSRPLRGDRVRLACVRHAASVDSEPGSNSHVRWFASRERPPRRTGTTHPRSDSTNTRPVMALALFARCHPPRPLLRADDATAPGISSSLSDWPRPTTPPRCYWSGTVEPDRHPLILDGLAVTFYLVFKEPACSLARRWSRRPPKGEPFKLTNP